MLAMSWPMLVLIVCGLLLVLGVLLMAKAGPQPDTPPEERRFTRPTQSAPPPGTAFTPPSPPASVGPSVWQIAQGVFWGLWLFVISCGVLGFLWLLFVYAALGGDNP